MTNLQKQLRLNALFEVLDTVRKSGISDFRGEAYSKYIEILEREIPKLDPLNEPDLITRAMITKNLLRVFEIDSKYGRIIEPEDWNTLRKRIIDAINDKSFENSDNEIAKEMQNINVATTKRMVRHRNNIYDKDDVYTVDDQLFRMLDDTVNNNTLDQELTAEDLVRGL